MSIVEELKRRNVFRAAIAYVIVAWLILQVGDTLAPALHLPESVNTALAFFLILGFPWPYSLRGLMNSPRRA
jgi:multidrug efflux pump subunit AcrB